MNLQNEISAFIEQEALKIDVKFNEPMASRTTFKTGGSAEVYAEPCDEHSLIQLLKFISSNSIKHFLIGGGSNIVFCDETFKGIVVSLRQFNSIKILNSDDCSNVNVECGAGNTISSLVNFCVQNELNGCQEFAGLPGSIGGVVFMNARCFNKSISDIFYEARYLDLKDNSIHTISYNESEWDYKKSPFTDGNRIILSAVFHFASGEKTKDELTREGKYFIDERKSKGHFNFPSAGSVFKNNHEFGKPSGAIIDQCGLKGTSIGGAKVADFHGNFIINTGNATSSQILQLVNYVKSEVFKKTGFSLECEIIFIQP